VSQTCGVPQGEKKRSKPHILTIWRRNQQPPISSHSLLHQSSLFTGTNNTVFTGRKQHNLLTISYKQSVCFAPVLINISKPKTNHDFSSKTKA
jgi:hypothetical protein